MPKGYRNADDNPSNVITAKMNPTVELEREALDIWRSISRRDIIRAGLTSKAEYLALALIQYHEGKPLQKGSALEEKVDQILRRLKSGNFGSRQSNALNEVDTEEVSIDFAENQQLLNSFIELE